MRGAAQETEVAQRVQFGVGAHGAAALKPTVPADTSRPRPDPETPTACAVRGACDIVVAGRIAAVPPAALDALRSAQQQLPAARCAADRCSSVQGRAGDRACRRRGVELLRRDETPGALRPVIGRKLQGPAPARSPSRACSRSSSSCSCCSCCASLPKKSACTTDARGELERLQAQRAHRCRQHQAAAGARAPAAGTAPHRVPARTCRCVTPLAALAVVLELEREAQHRAIAAAQVALEFQQQPPQRKQQRGGIVHLAAEFAARAIGRAACARPAADHSPRRTAAADRDWPQVQSGARSPRRAAPAAVRCGAIRPSAAPPAHLAAEPAATAAAARAASAAARAWSRSAAVRPASAAPRRWARARARTHGCSRAAQVRLRCFASNAAWPPNRRAAGAEFEPQQRPVGPGDS